MSHKVHPKIFRINNIAEWDSRWLSNKSLAKYLEEDFRIREFLENKLKDAWVEKIEIERFSDRINIIINSARPGLIIGRGGKGIEELKKNLEKKVFKNKKNHKMRLEIREVRDFWANANLTGQWIAQQLEKRIHHRRALKQALQKIMISKEVKGARVEVAGRLNGVEIARTEWLRQDKLPRQTLRANIDYGTAIANCTYGAIGVKVWIYKGEKF